MLAGGGKLDHCGAARQPLFGATEEIQCFGNVLLKFRPFNNRIKESVLQQELAALESLRQLLADGLFNNAGTREADERAGFGRY